MTISPSLKHAAAVFLTKQAYQGYYPPQAPAPATPVVKDKNYWLAQQAAHRQKMLADNGPDPILNANLAAPLKLFPASKAWGSFRPDNWTLNNAKETWDESVGPAASAMGGILGHPVQWLSDRLFAGGERPRGIQADGSPESRWSHLKNQIADFPSSASYNSAATAPPPQQAPIVPLAQTAWQGAKMWGGPLVRGAVNMAKATNPAYQMINRSRTALASGPPVPGSGTFRQAVNRALGRQQPMPQYSMAQAIPQ